MRITGDEPSDSLYPESGDITFVVAASSGVDSKEKSMLLAMETQDERLAWLSDHLHDALGVVLKAQPIIQSTAAGYALMRTPKIS